MSDSRFYVYGHYTPDTNQLFYIGKGCDRRAWEQSGRNPYWRNKVKKHNGFVVKMFAEQLEEQAAYQQEKTLIEQYGRENLTNLAEGGKGMTSAYAHELHANPEFQKKWKAATQSPEYKKKWRAATIDNPEWRKRISMTFDGFVSPDNIVYAPVINLEEFCREHQLHPRLLLKVEVGQRHHHRGWFKYTPDWVQRKQQYYQQAAVSSAGHLQRVRRRPTAVGFLAPDGTAYYPIENIAQFAKEHNLRDQGFHKILSGEQRHYKGWRVYQPPTDTHLQFFSY